MAADATHKPQFYVDVLTPIHADSAYPLIRSVAPEVSLEDWRDYVQRRYRSGGVLGLWDGRGGIVGVMSYRLGERMRHGLVLALDDFVTFELSQAAPGRRILLEAAEKLAYDLGCKALEIRLGARGFADQHAARAQGWASLGVSLDSVIFVKPLQR
jgi:hypothetical protein